MISADQLATPNIEHRFNYSNIQIQHKSIYVQVMPYLCVTILNSLGVLDLLQPASLQISGVFTVSPITQYIRSATCNTILRELVQPQPSEVFVISGKTTLNLPRAAQSYQQIVQNNLQVHDPKRGLIHVIFHTLDSQYSN